MKSAVALVMYLFLKVEYKKLYIQLNITVREALNFMGSDGLGTPVWQCSEYLTPCP